MFPKSYTAAQRITQYWASLGYVVEPGAAEQALKAFELEHNVQLPSDIREYFALYGGFEGGRNWDERFITFWPLESVTKLSDLDGEYVLPHGLGSSSSFFIFGDFLVHSHFYAIRLTVDPSANCPVVSHGGDYKFGDSFSDFVDVYLREPDLVASPPISS